MKPAAAFLALFCASLANAAESGPRFFGARPGVLPEVKQRLAAGDRSLQPALDRLLEDADRALRISPTSVMEKTRVPPSGDKHDYMSTAPYFWPDPARSNGLPYIRHDGKVNPESRGAASDHGRIGRMSGAVETLALAYYFSGKEAYARHAAERLRVWFLDTTTCMNPNFRYAQAVPGVNDGRGTGIIESRTIAQAADAAQMLTGSSAWTAQDDAAFHRWLNAFLDWLLTSTNGREEAAARNNHGTFYDVQVVRLALVLGKTDLARQIAEAARQKRIAAQIEPDGQQPLELKRTASLGYSRFNLEAFFELATAAEHVGVDLWSYQSPQGGSIRKALDFLLPYADVPPKEWPYEQIKPTDPKAFAPLLRQAAVIFHEPKYERLLDKYGDVSDRRWQLFCPDFSERPHKQGRAGPRPYPLRSVGTRSPASPTFLGNRASSALSTWISSSFSHAP